MSTTKISVLQGVLVDEQIQFTLLELSRVCRVASEQLVELVDEGVLTPKGDNVQTWLFAGSTLRRAMAALRIRRDLELSAAGVALVLDLIDEIEALKARLRCRGGH